MDLRAQLQSTLGSAYRIERELGGGMARVFVAEETALRRKVVIKVLPPDMAATLSTERFRREIMLVARLQHAHIVPLLSAGETGGLAYFTMPFVEGESLRMRLAQRGELPLSEATRILREVASALAYAHEHGVVHRDIKPDNVLLSRDAAMVSDFGVAKALSESAQAEYGSVQSLGLTLGTPMYMAPEQASADPATDHRADIYSFGVLAYEVLTGAPPFTGQSPQRIIAAHASEPPHPIAERRPGISPQLATLVMRCLEKRPADRPQTVVEVLHGLDELSVVPSDSSRALSPPHGVIAGEKRRFVSGRVALGAVGVLLTVTIVTAIVLSSRRSKERSAEPRAAVAGPGVRAIAVLPFVNVGADSAFEYFADGMTDELADELARLPGVRVAARTSSYAFKGRNVDASEVGRSLHVDALVQGSVRRAAGRVKVTAALVYASDGLSMWSQSYETELRDVLQMQDRVGQAIANALKVTLGGGSRSLLSTGTDSVEAHDLYLQGMFYLQKYTEKDLRSSLALFARAVTNDPRYAAPWAATARAWINLADDWLPPREAYPTALEAARRALTLDSTNADAHAMLANIEQNYEWNFAAGERELRRALALDPRHIEARMWLSHALWRRGARDSALVQARLAVEADPVSPLVARLRAYRQIAAGQLDSAEAGLRRAREFDPAHVPMKHAFTFLRLAQGRWAEALQEVEPVGALDAYGQSLAAVAEAHLARTADAKRRLLALVARRAHRYVAADLIASGYAALGDRDATFRWLDQAYTDRAAGLADLTSFLWDPVRDDPRFAALQRRVNARNGSA